MTAAGAQPGTSRITLHLNGEPRTLTVANHEPLLRVLRRDLGLTSVRGTCGIGVCGTCTVLLDGRAVSACILLAPQADRAQVTTAEGLRTPGGDLGAVQDAFVRHGAYQCSFCIPAMTLSVHAALRERPGARVEDVREALGGNLCRCGTYPQILEAVAELVTTGAATGPQEGPDARGDRPATA